jgi:broad specificity phosphatase PhoE
MKLTVVRHGESEGNVLHLVQSHTDGMLTEIGHMEAEETARLLSSERFDIAYSSDLGRCMETTDILLRYHPGAQRVFTTRLRERDQGDYEGRQWEDLPWFGKEAECLATKVPNGESWLQTRQRIGSLVNEVYHLHPTGNVLFVTHGGPIKVLHSLLGGVSLKEAVDTPIGNATISRWQMQRPVLYGTVQ